MPSKKTRREFIETSAKAGLMLPLLGSSFFACGTSAQEEAPQQAPKKKLNILILGGTSFLGPHQIAYALEQGHSISIFTRGKTKSTVHQALFDKVEHLVGDRNDNLEALKGRKWDAVIDNSGHRVAWTTATAELLKDNVDLYMYTSSIGVYYPYNVSTLKEDGPITTEIPEGVTDGEEKYEYDYTVMKANSELEAQRVFGEDRSIIIRPTYIVGPAARHDRFIYWPVRLSKGGEVMIPGKSDDPVQFIDVRDLASWMIRLIEEKNTGVFNAVGPESRMGMQAFVEEASKAFDVETSFTLIDDYDFLKKHEVHYIVPWVMPLGNNDGTAKASVEKCIANGLTFTPLVKTIKDTHDWWYSDNLTEERRQKFEGKEGSIYLREAEILKAWKERG